MTLIRGVTFLICTHNGRVPLARSLADLSRQRTRYHWELIVVDNASTDGTLDFARAHWRELGAPAPARFLTEPRIGKTHAFWTGVAQAKYSVLTVVDDDNGLAAGWIDTVVTEMERDPEVGGIASQGEVVSRDRLPSWYAENSWSFAVVREMPRGRLDLERVGRVPGAGVSLRTAAVQELAARGFQQYLAGRIGPSYDAPGGEDIELHLALRLAGWQFSYQPALRFRHYLADGRVTWANVRAMARCNGKCDPTLEAYHTAVKLGRRERPRRLRLRSRWQWAAAVSFLKCLFSARALWKIWRGTDEGSNTVLRFEKHWTRVQTLRAMGDEYQRRLDAVAGAAWWPSRLVGRVPEQTRKIG